MKPNQTHRTHRTAGFTLVELMIVVAIVSILAAIAVPMYDGYVERARRADGRAALLRAAQWLERAATVSGQYPTAAQFNAAGLSTSEGNHYTVALTAVTLNTFTLTGTGVLADTKCGNLTLTEAGIRGRSGTGLTVDACWNR